MITLYLDTTSSFLYAGIIKDNKLVSEVKEHLGKDLSVYTLDRVSKMIEEANLTPKDINKIIVVNGPGSFTGIRIGITIAKTYAWALGTKITTISSLDAMAVSSEFVGYKIPVIDARRDASYYGIYDKDNNIVDENKYLTNTEILDKVNNLDGPYVFISNETTIEDNNIENYSPNIERIVNKYIDKEEINPHGVNPIYLKSTEAEEKANEN